MKTIDVRFSDVDMAEIESMVGKKMIGYKGNSLMRSSSVYGVVGIRLEDDSYAFTNQLEVMDYYGELEDVARFRIAKIDYADIRSLLRDRVMVENPINKIIINVAVVNECQRLFERDIQIYDVKLTRGIIFSFEDGSELSLEKNIWFSEMITVEKGHDLIERFTPVEEFAEGWSKEYRGECFREAIFVG